MNFERNISKLLNQLIFVLKNKNKILCIGHDKIDVDAFFSALLTSRLFKYLGIESEFVIMQPVIQDDTYKIIKDLTGIEISDYERANEEISNILFLVDHYETTHLGTVIGCIDHHPTSKENTYPFSYIRNATAATYMVYELMKEANYPLTAEEAKYIVISMLVDTTSFKNSKSIAEEIIAAKELAAQFNLDYDYLEKYCLCLTPIDTMTVAEIVSHGQKSYNYNGHRVASSYLQLYDMPSKETLNNWLNYIKYEVVQKCKTSPELFVFIIFDTLNNKTYEYNIRKDFIKSFIYDGILSRGKDIMPKIEKELAIKRSCKKTEANLYL